METCLVPIPPTASQYGGTKNHIHLLTAALARSSSLNI